MQGIEDTLRQILLAVPCNMLRSVDALLHAGLQFDRVLCDVPCCGDGTLRKSCVEPGVQQLKTHEHCSQHGLHSRRYFGRREPVTGCLRCARRALGRNSGSAGTMGWGLACTACRSRSSSVGSSCSRLVRPHEPSRRPPRMLFSVYFVAGAFVLSVRDGCTTVITIGMHAETRHE